VASPVVFGSVSPLTVRVGFVPLLELVVSPAEQALSTSAKPATTAATPPRMGDIFILPPC
jgi:hypothetical protein